MGQQEPKRRKDSELRASIERVQSEFIGITTKPNAYFCILRELCALSDSSFGAAFEFDNSNEFICLKGITSCKKITDTASNISWSENEFTDSIDVANHTESLFSSLYNNQAIIILKHQITELPIPDNWQKINSMLVIPVQDSKDSIALLMLCNSPMPYETSFHQRVIPLLTTLISMLRVLVNKSEDHENRKHLMVQKNLWRDNFQHLELHAPMGMMTLNKQHEIVRLNPMAENILKIKGLNVLGKNINSIFPERFPNEHATQTFLPDETNTPKRLTAVNEHGEQTSVEITLLHYNEFFLPRVLLLICDATELRQVKHSMNQEIKRFRTLADLAPMGILQTDANWKTEYINHRWLEFCGVEIQYMQGLNWCNTFHPDEAETILKELHEHLTQGNEYECECKILQPDSHVLWVHLYAQPIFNKEGKVNGFMATLVDNTYIHESEEKLRKLAEEDTLTQLANRSLFMSRLEHALASVKRQGSLALLSIDLDGFKNVNDSLGHDAGDELLKQVAERLLSDVRETDTVSRIGGDEFNILLEGVSEAQMVAQIAEKILASISSPFIVKRQEVYISSSIGISFAVTGTPNSSKNLLKQADLALYRAKFEGKNNYQYFSPELNEASHKKLELGNGLHQALKRKEFKVYYQIQADVATNTFIGFEALVRWDHPVKGIIGPDSFIPLLEETGLIIQVSRFVWRESFIQMQEWLNAGVVSKNAVMSVNLSPRQIRDPSLIDTLKTCLDDAKLAGKHVVIEITETALIHESSDILKVLSGFKSLGARIALDDFGTGFSSLSHLKKFPIDIIKIDKSFVSDLLDDQDDACIVEAVIALGHSLNLEVLAEGVETNEILEALHELDCHHYQGYILNKPMPAVQMNDFLKVTEKQRTH